MKKYSALLFGFIMLLMLCSAAQGAFPLTVTDSQGNTVTINEQPKTIVSLAPANTEILFALGAGDQVIGDTRYCNYPEAAKNITKIGEYSTISIEKITSLKPDIIFANEMNGLANIDQLKNLGFTVVVISPTSMDTVYSSIALVGDCIGKSDEAEKVIADMKTRVKAVTGKLADTTSKPTVMHAMSTNPYWISGANTFQDELITLAGGKNAFADVDGWKSVTLEKLITTNPDLILTDPGADMGSPGEDSLKNSFYEDNRLSSVSAVKNKNIYVMDSDIFDRGGPRAVDALEQLAKLIHPEIFGTAAEPTKAASTPGFGAAVLICGLAAAALILKRK